MIYQMVLHRPVELARKGREVKEKVRIVPCKRRADSEVVAIQKHVGFVGAGSAYRRVEKQCGINRRRSSVALFGTGDPSTKDRMVAPPPSVPASASSVVKGVLAPTCG